MNYLDISRKCHGRTDLFPNFCVNAFYDVPQVHVNTFHLLHCSYLILSEVSSYLSFWPRIFRTLLILDICRYQTRLRTIYGIFTINTKTPHNTTRNIVHWYFEPKNHLTPLPKNVQLLLNEGVLTHVVHIPCLLSTNTVPSGALVPLGLALTFERQVLCGRRNSIFDHKLCWICLRTTRHQLKWDDQRLCER